MNTERQDLEIAKAALVEIVDSTWLEADLILPQNPVGVVLLVHGSGSSRLSPRNRFVAQLLRERGLATMLLDTETPEERVQRLQTERSQITLADMASRIELAMDWLCTDPHAAGLPIGYFGAGTGAAAAFIAAAAHPKRVRAIVARGGRLELAHDSLPLVRAPTLLIVGARDIDVVQCNRAALDEIGSNVKALEIIPGARHLFEEPGTLTAVGIHAAGWFSRYLPHDSSPSYAVVHQET